jgi:TetR/AcrR family transcriptional regulator, cholesterol catabolism regulator
MPAAVPTRKRPANGDGDSRFDRRLGEILAHATAVFYDKGYAGASMRDLSRESGMSLAGLYHYFESKEKLLFLIQRHTFSTILERLRARLAEEKDPVEQVRLIIRNHLEYFLANRKAMKVLSHEADVLKNGYGSEVTALKREYYRICMGVLDELKRARGLEFQSRIAVMSLFGMMNWIYTWHNGRSDAGAATLAQEMSDIFLDGLLAQKSGRKKK